MQLKILMKNRNGFTLVELLVVIAIIAILAAVVAPNAFKAIEKSKIAALTTDYRAIKTATLVYFSDTGQWPADNAGAVGFVTNTATPTNGWNGPYVDTWQTNAPIGTTYEFVNGAATGATGVRALSTTELGSLSGDALTSAQNSVYLLVNDLPVSAHAKLIADLGNGVIFPATTTSTTTLDTYILIAKK